MGRSSLKRFRKNIVGQINLDDIVDLHIQLRESGSDSFSTILEAFRKKHKLTEREAIKISRINVAPIFMKKNLKDESTTIKEMKEAINE